MIPLARLEEHLRHLSRDKIEVILGIRNIVAAFCPDTVERLDRNGITYYDAKRGGPVKAGICQIVFGPDALRLDFIHGAFLPDPAHLLSGDNLAKHGMDLGDYGSIPWDAVTDLITASSRFDPYSLLVKDASGQTLIEKVRKDHQIKE
jgi:hypothetical protein